MSKGSSLTDQQYITAAIKNAETHHGGSNTPTYIAVSNPSNTVSSVAQEEQSRIKGDRGDKPPNSGSHYQRIVGRASAWICTTLYLTSRLPQIWKNVSRRSSTVPQVGDIVLILTVTFWNRSTPGNQLKAFRFFSSYSRSWEMRLTWDRSCSIRAERGVVKAAEQRRRGHITCWKLCRELLFLFFCLLLSTWHEGQSYDVRVSCTVKWTSKIRKVRSSRHSVFFRAHGR